MSKRTTFVELLSAVMPVALKIGSDTSQATPLPVDITIVQRGEGLFGWFACFMGFDDFGEPYAGYTSKYDATRAAIRWVSDNDGHLVVKTATEAAAESERRGGE